MSFSDYYKKWKEENNVTEEIEYNPNLTQAERNEFIEQSMNRRIEDVTNRIRQANANRTQSTTQSQEKSIWDRVQDISNFSNNSKLMLNNNKNTDYRQSILNAGNRNKVLEQETRKSNNLLETLNNKDKTMLFSEKEKQVVPIKENNDEKDKNENILEDAGSLATLVGLGVSTGGKEVFNYIESANENNFDGYKDLKKRQFLTSQKVNEEDKAKAKIQDNLLLSSNGIKTADENRVETNLVKKAIRDSINKDNEKIQEEQNKISNQGMQTLGKIAPSMGQMLPGMALNAVNPILGTTYFTTSAGGGYIDDALNRGMNEEQAFKYGTVMGALESASESMITGQQLSKVRKAFTGKEISKKLLNSYGFNIFENAVQEAVMEPAQEITAGIVGDKADWSNMGSRMLESGFNGALMGAISNGVTFGLEKSGNVYDKIKNGENITETEYKEALQENINKFGKNAVENAMKNGATEVYQEINNLRQNSTQNEQILPTQQINQEQNNVAQNENMNQILPTQNKVVITDNDNLISSAKKYNLNYKDLSIENSQKALEKRGIKARFDENYFNNESEGGKYILTTDENGNVTREIIINPKADEKTIIQEMTIHELTHDIIAGKTDKSVKMYNEIKDFLYKDKDFSSKLAQLEEAYLNIKDENGNPVYNRNDSKFNSMIEEEAIAKTLQKKFGTQEEVNRLVNYTPSKARMVYDWIVDKLNKITGGRIEKLYWEDVKNKFERAFSEEGNYKNSGNIERHYFNNVDYFDEIEYNKAIPEQLDSKTWKSIDDSIGREELKPGVYETEAFDYANDTWKRYTIMYKEKGEYKIVDSESIDENDYTEGANNELRKYSRETYTGDEGTRGNRVYLERDNKQTKNRKETADDVRLPIRNKEYSDTNRKDNIEVNRNKTNEGLEKSSSFNLPGKDMRYSVNTDGSMKDNKTGKKVILDAETGSSDKTLLAIHNLTEDKLKGVLELGGFPVPSIAVTNPDLVNHSQFGDISVIFNKNTINPEIDSRNEVYDRDVWSPTFPRVDYDISNSTIKDYITKGLQYDYKDDIISSAITNYMYDSNLLDKIDRSGFEETLKDLKNSKELKYFYKNVVEKGEYSPKTKPLQYNKKYSNETLQRFIDSFNEDMNLSDFYYHYMNYQDMQMSDEQRQKLKDNIKKAIEPEIENEIKEDLEKKPNLTKEEQEKYRKALYEIETDWIENRPFELREFVANASQYLENGERQIVDKESTLNDISNHVNQEQFEKWIDDSFGKMFKNAKKGIRNNKDPYTPSGNLRSFNQLHEDYNLQNVVNYMIAKDTKGGEGGFMSGGFGEIQAKQGNKFNSISDIKENENRLVVSEEASKQLEPLKNNIHDDIEELSSYYKSSSYYNNSWENSANAISEFSGKSKLTEANLKKVLDSYYNFDVENIPKEVYSKIIKDLNNLKNITTDYFEAKPQRAVGFDEIDAIVIPKDVSKEVKQQLKDRGIKTIEYDRNNENERADILKSLNEYKFSKTSESFDEYLTRRIGKEGTRTNLQDIKLPTKQKILPTQEANNRPKETSNEASFNLPVKENNTQNSPTKGETINWNEIERPEGKIRKHYRSIIESSNTTAEAKAIAKEMMGLDTYTPQSNESLLQKADSRISTTNPETELKSLLSRVMNNEKVNDVDMAVGERLIEYYSKIGDSEHLQDAIHATALAGTQAGRTVQAMALLNHMTPQGQVVWLERSVNKANKELEQKFKNKKNIPQFELTSDMTEKILNTKSKEEMYKVLDDVYEELGQQVPKTTLEKIDEWRYFSMLANVKTHGRNMIGNVAMNLTQRAKNKVAGAIEGTVAKFNPEMERTHTIVPTSKKVKDFAKNDVKNMDVQTELGMNENKYNPQSRLQSARRTFKSDVLENTLGKMFDLNSKLLEVEDNIGLKSMYVKSLGEYITANKIDIDNMTDAQLSKARQHAIKEAQEATFHQASALATALNQMGRKNNIAKFALDSAVPFKKTPINVAKTGVQYSPVGLIKSAVYDVRKVRKGNMSINQYIDNVSKGLTGTGITFLGYVLAEAGILKASGEDDDKKEKYDEEQGKQTYSIEIGGKTATLDWLSPVGIPLFIGAEINQQFNTTKKEKNSKSNDDEEKLNQIIKGVADIANASANAINPMSEMSMISGLTSVLSSYNKENAVGDMIVNTGKSYINQFVPTLMSQIARTTDDYERTTKSTKTGTLEKAVDSTINQVKSKIPGLRQTLPVRTDIWGKKVEQSQNIPIRALNNFINPSNIKEISTSQVDEELNKFYIKTGENSILPKAIENKYTIDGTDYTMTNEEYAKYNKKYGETSYKLIQDLINSKDYKELTDNQKQKAIESVYSYAKESNKIEYANDNKLDVEQSTLYKTLTQLKNDGGNLSDYLEYIGKIDGIKGEGEGKKKIGILAESNYSDKTKEIIYKNTEGSKDSKVEYLVDKLGFPIQQYLRYRQQDFENDKNEYNETIKGSKKQKVLNYLNTIPDSRLSMEYKKIICQMENNSDYAGDVARFINNSNKLTSDEKTSLLKKMNFEIDRYGNIKNKIMLPISKTIK